MATYAIGDIHGCFDTFQRLLKRVRFDAGRDRLWLTGDLINGGPDSLATLRWVVEHADIVDCVLGNHDLHMLAVAAGARKMRKKDNFNDVLDAPDADELLEWLQHQRLALADAGYLLVHAGLWPAWSADDAIGLADEVEQVLGSDEAGAFFEHMYGNKPRRFDEELSGHDRLRVIVNAMTRLRVLKRRKQALAFDFSGPPERLPKDRMPWFEAPAARWTDHTVIFGHWSAIGFYKEGPAVCLDSGCVWGGKLTAMRLHDEAIFQVTSQMPKTV